jgi:hypothetical protein
MFISAFSVSHQSNGRAKVVIPLPSLVCKPLLSVFRAKNSKRTCQNQRPILILARAGDKPCTKIFIWTVASGELNIFLRKSPDTFGTLNAS